MIIFNTKQTIAVQIVQTRGLALAICKNEKVRLLGHETTKKDYGLTFSVITLCLYGKLNFFYVVTIPYQPIPLQRF